MVDTLCLLARSHPAPTLPFLPALLATAAHLGRGAGREVEFRLSLTGAVTAWGEAVLDTEPGTPSNLQQYHDQADTLYELVLGTWLGQAREREGRVSALAALAALTPLLSPALLQDRAATHLNSILGLYRKLSPGLGSTVEV